MCKKFLRSEVGAITVDWVTVTAALIILGIAVVYSLFSNGVSPVTNAINSQVESGSAELCNGDVENCHVIEK